MKYSVVYIGPETGDLRYGMTGDAVLLHTEDISPIWEFTPHNKDAVTRIFYNLEQSNLYFGPPDLQRP
jgi:hypothetical protein